MTPHLGAVDGSIVSITEVKSGRTSRRQSPLGPEMFPTLLAIADEVIEGTFRNASIGGGEVT